MNTSPTFHSTNPSTAPKGNHPPSISPTPSGTLWRRLWTWWSSLTGPSKQNFGKDIFSQERLRRARLVSALLIIVVITVIMVACAIYPSSPSLVLPVIILSVGGVGVALLNRAGYSTLSSILYVLLADTALAGFFIFKSSLNSSNMSGFALFMLTVLIGGMILPKVLIPFNGIVQVTLICTIFFLRPHDPSMEELIQIAGNSYVALMNILLLHVIGTGIAWLQAWSVERALLRANLAEELAEARAELNRQAELIAEHNVHLQEGITSILETHRQVAAGNFSARAPVQEDRELWQVGHSLNLLLMRVQQQALENGELRLIKQEIEQVLASYNGALSTPISCRTSLGRYLLRILRR
jgi:hypothetical protein